MMRNDYRRALIMFRSNVPGYSGHVRLERRTLMGSMYFMINVPDGRGDLCAVLIRKDRQGTYYPTKLGTLRRDGRGQASLSYSFDPRNIDGYALEDYFLIVIVNSDQARCDIVLSGYVAGSQEVNWTNARIAACDLCRCDTGASCNLADRPPQYRPPQYIPPEQIPIVPPRPQPQDRPQTLEEPPVIDPDYPPAYSPPAGTGENVQQDAVPETGGIPDAGFDEPAVDLPAAEGEPPAGEQGAVIPMLPVAEEGVPKAEPTAGELLGIDMSLPWPDAVESVRSIFAGQPADELMLNDGYTYVRAPMPEGSGYSYCNIGVCVKDGVPASVSYALPSRYSPEPPPGLEDYVWQGGAADGWWTIRTDVQTGEKLM